jgi:hypothetical protein
MKRLIPLKSAAVFCLILASPALAQRSGGQCQNRSTATSTYNNSQSFLPLQSSSGYNPQLQMAMANYQQQLFLQRQYQQQMFMQQQLALMQSQAELTKKMEEQREVQAEKLRQQAEARKAKKEDEKAKRTEKLANAISKMEQF